jgi:hypothetical protein
VFVILQIGILGQGLLVIKALEGKDYVVLVVLDGLDQGFYWDVIRNILDTDEGDFGRVDLIEFGQDIIQVECYIRVQGQDYLIGVVIKVGESDGIDVGVNEQIPACLFEGL